jgi:hypothetical protein
VAISPHKQEIASAPPRNDILLIAFVLNIEAERVFSRKYRLYGEAIKNGNTKRSDRNDQAFSFLQAHETLSRPRLIIFVLCIFFVLYIYGLPMIFETFLGASGLTRIILSMVLICPLGITMGMAFPLGIRLLEQDGPAMIPWVWGVNGACSVMGSILAWGLSLNFGYNTTLWTAMAVYGCAFLVMILKPYSVQQEKILPQ